MGAAGAAPDGTGHLRFYREWSAEEPDELTTMVVQRKAPPPPFVPREAQAGPGPGGAWAARAADGPREGGPWRPPPRARLSRYRRGTVSVPCMPSDSWPATRQGAARSAR